MLSAAFLDLYHEVRSTANLATLLVTVLFLFGSLTLLVPIAFTRPRRLSQRAALILSYSFIVKNLQRSTFLRRRILVSLMLCMPAAFDACGSGPSSSLPAELLGQWYFLSSSGGIDGEGGNGEATDYIVLHRDRMDVYEGGGALPRQEVFSPLRGKTIYSDEDLWILNFEREEPLVVLVSPDGQTMSLSPNAYDSVSQEYSRSR